MNRGSMNYHRACSSWITFVERLQFLKMSNHHSTFDQNNHKGGLWPPTPFLFVCYLLYAPCERAMHKFGVAVHVRYST